jgi:hypothetical protein
MLGRIAEVATISGFLLAWYLVKDQRLKWCFTDDRGEQLAAGIRRHLLGFGKKGLLEYFIEFSKVENHYDDL